LGRTSPRPFRQAWASFRQQEPHPEAPATPYRVAPEDIVAVLDFLKPKDKKR
jgi:hypothetical protein